jgi:beta-N-acetylhexosaminidase
MRSKSPSVSAGQLLIIGFDGMDLTPRVRSLLGRIQPAGIILFRRNIDDAAQTWRLLRDCQKCVRIPLFTCIDLEGGTVDRFRDLLGPAPAAAEVFATGDHKLFRQHGKIIGENCRALGFNVDFAPVFDLAFAASREVMTSRVVSADPKDTIIYARAFLAGLRSAKVLGCGKHFPGLGEGTLDSHKALPVIDKSWKKLWAEDLLPYRRLHRLLPTVMIAHAAYPEVTGDRTPASMSSRWVTQILRKRIGFRGLAISDDLEMGGVLAAASIGDAAVKSIRAGADICLVCHRESRVEEVYEHLHKTVERDEPFAREVERASGRVTAFKKKWVRTLPRTSKPPTASAVEKLTRCLWEFGEQVRLESLNRGEKTGRRRA